MADILKCKSVWILQGEPGHQLTQLNSPGQQSASWIRGEWDGANPCLSKCMAWGGHGHVTDPDTQRRVIQGLQWVESHRCPPHPVTSVLRAPRECATEGTSLRCRGTHAFRP